jgi:glutathione S-transferase
MTVAAALDRKGLEYERVELRAPHTQAMEEIYGEGNRTVPGLLIDGEPVHGSRTILARLEELVPDPPLYPPGRAADVRAAEEWGDVELQDLGRRLPWGAMRFRPEAMGTWRQGGEPLDPAGVDFALRYVHASWKYHRITAERLAEDLAGLPAKLDHVEALAADGVIGGDEPNAADLQIGATIRVLLPIEDLQPLLAGTAAEAIARRWFPEYPGRIPAGAYPAGWVPERAAAR